MLDLITAAILGIVEGVTEFLPISSTGHLILAGEALGFTGDTANTFEIFIQLGAILAVVWTYRGKIFDFFGASGKEESRKSLNLWMKVFVAFLPAAIVGFLLHDTVKEYLFRPEVVAGSLIVGGILILVIESLVKKFSVDSLEKVSWKKSLSVGFAQILALIPGVSRSGATILGGMVSGMNRVTATEFSFFLAIPTMFAATLYDLYKSASLLQASDFPMFAVGFLVSFFSALVVIQFLLKFVSTHTFRVFAWYRIVLGVIVILALA